MSYGFFFFFLLLVLVQCKEADYVPDRLNRQKCETNLHNYYGLLGLNLTQYPEPQELVSIQRIFNPNGIIIEFQMEGVAHFYQSLIPSFVVPPAPDPIVHYVSFHKPYCATDIEVLCGGELVYGLPKTAACAILDYDLGTEATSGRFFVYRGNQSTDTCIGNIKVKMLGEFEWFRDNADIHYTFSATGLPQGNYSNLTYEEALYEYQHSLCASPTPFPFLNGQYQFACVDVLYRCIETRPGQSVADVTVPIPTFACRGNITPNGPTVIVWHVSALGDFDATTFTTYGIHFCAQYDDACKAIHPEPHTIFLGTRYQYASPFNSFSSVEVLTFPGDQQSYTNPVYTAGVTDPFIRDVPCVCGFSLVCAFGTVYEAYPGRRILVADNAGPVADAGSTAYILPGRKSVNLSLSLSFDPDNQPFLLSYVWEVYNVTPTPVVIDNWLAVNVSVTADYILGTYRFIGRVSDGQDLAYDLVDIQVSLNVIVIVLERYIEVQYEDLFYRCPANEADLFSMATALNASESYGENPTYPLTYNWTQIGGSLITPVPTPTSPFVCDSETVTYYPVEAFWATDQPIAYFVPPALGIYVFRLTICDFGVSPCRFQDIHISVEDDLDDEGNPRRNYTDSPNAPSFDTNREYVPTISFPPVNNYVPFDPYTRKPSAHQPSAPSNEDVPTTQGPTPAPTGEVIFPLVPAPGLAENAIMIIVFAGMIAILAVLVGYCWAQQRANPESKRARIKVYNQ